MEYKSVDAKIKKLWYIRRSFFVLTMIIILIAFISANISSQGEEFPIPLIGFIAWIIVWSIFFLVSILNAYVLPYFQYKVYKYKVENEELWFNKGVIFKNEFVIPFCQIQNFSISQGPFEAIFKLKSLNISTAGSGLVISGLTKDEAIKLETILKDNVKIFVNKKINGEINEKIS